MMMVSPPRKNGLTFCLSADIMVVLQVSFAISGIVNKSRSSTNSIASSAISTTIPGQTPAGTYWFLTCSSAFLQSLPKPNSSEALIISASHQAYCLSPSLISSSAVYGIMLYCNSFSIFVLPIGLPMIPEPSSLTTVFSKWFLRKLEYARSV